MQINRRVPKLHSIFVKLSAATVFSVALVAGFLAYMNWQTAVGLVSDVVKDRAVEETVALSAAAAESITSGKGESVYELLSELTEHSKGAARTGVVVAVDGLKIEDPAGASTDDQALLALARESLETKSTKVSADGFSVATPAVLADSNEVVGAIATTWSSEPLLTRMRDGEIIALETAGLILLMVIAGNMYVLSRVIAGPLQRVRTVIEGFANRDYATEVPMQSKKDELGSIATSLEELRTTLRAAQTAELDNTYKSAAFSGSSAAMLLVDTNMVVTHFNAKIVDLFRTHAGALRRRVAEFDPENLLGLSVARFHTDAQHARASHGLRNIGSGAFTTVIKLDEARISLSAVAIRDAQGKEVGYVMEWADVTKNWMNATLVHAIDSNQIKAEFDLDGTLVAANGQFQKLMGQGLEDLRTRTIADLILPGSLDVMPTLRSVAKGEIYLGMLKLQRRGEDTAVVDGSLNCVTDHEGRPIRILLLGKDVTVAERELEASRKQRAEAEAQQSAVVEALRLGLRKLNAGDLIARIDDPFAGSYEELRLDFNNTIRSLAQAMQDILSNAENIRNEANDISSTADGLSRRTENTAATLEQTAAALDLLTNSVKSTADGAERADQAVTAARQNAESSSKVVVETVSAMDQIASSSERITSIIKVIDDIAFQTNLLALNAGVEAARAGEAGRGFAVVASEVRALAQRSSDAAREINELIASSAGQVRRGVTLVDRTGEALKEIAGSVSEIAGLVSDIAVASRQQSANLVEINSAVMQLDQSTQQNAARLEETTAASEGLTKDAVALVKTVSHFKVGASSAADQVVAFPSERSGNPTKIARPAASAMVGKSKVSGSGKPDSVGWEDF